MYDVQHLSVPHYEDLFRIDVPHAGIIEDSGALRECPFTGESTIEPGPR